VVRELVSAGLAPDNVSGASFGEFRPVADNSTPEGKTANRRIEIVVLPDLSQLPGFDELRRYTTP
jgi:chemotaxis protein MotB